LFCNRSNQQLFIATTAMSCRKERKARGSASENTAEDLSQIDGETRNQRE